jgi:hypothetical protein
VQLGVLGGVGYTPHFLRRQIAELKVRLYFHVETLVSLTSV